MQYIYIGLCNVYYRHGDPGSHVSAGDLGSFIFAEDPGSHVYTGDSESFVSAEDAGSLACAGDL